MKNPEWAPGGSGHSGFRPTAPPDLPVSARSISTHPRKRRSPTREQLAKLGVSERSIAGRVERALDRNGCHVALISRAGRDLSRLRFDGTAPVYTHTGFAIREHDSWRIYQMLNVGGGPEGHLFRQSLTDFFRDDPHEYRCGLLAPGSALQERIRATLDSPLANRLHSPRYSRLSYPFATRYQNSNQWVAEIVGAAQSSLSSRPAIQDYLRRRGLSPTVLRVPGYLSQCIFACFSSNTRFDDHPLRDRMRGRIAFLTETSIRDHLQATDCLTLDETIRLTSSRIPEPAPQTQPVAGA